MEQPQKMKYAKPEGFQGRGKGATNWRKYKWAVDFTEGDSVIKSGKYVSIQDINDKEGLNLTGDIVWRLRTGNRVDTTQKNKDNSFLSRYGHLKINKISEWIDGVHPKDTRNRRKVKSSGNENENP